MTCQIIFLPVGNADSIVIQSESSTIIVDIGKPKILEDLLQKNKTSKIDKIYITHAHEDHCPSLTNLVDFLSNLRNKISIEHLHFPYDLIRAARSKIKAHKNNPNYNSKDLKSKKYQRLDDALIRIEQWSRNNEITHSPIVLNGEKYFDGILKVEALHPSQAYIESHFDINTSKLNEISTVLRVGYGKFSALLLADIEGAGLTELLNFWKLNSKKTDFTTNIVKMPHHGAYPKNGKDLEELLALVDAELAILSVGSTNTYGHVEPKLFKALIELQKNGDRRLTKFICTEVTRTCVHSASDRLTMGKSGLAKSQKCAGEITIIADVGGKWDLKTETDHSNEIKNFQYAACDGRSDFI